MIKLICDFCDHYFLWMNVWICPPVAAVDWVIQSCLVTVSTTLLCTRQAARCWGVGFAWQLARRSAAYCQPAGSKSETEAAALAFSLLNTLRQTHRQFDHTHSVMISFFSFKSKYLHLDFAHTQPIILSLIFACYFLPEQINPPNPTFHSVLWPHLL